MADTQASLKPVIWAKELFREVMADLFFLKTGLAGVGSNFVIQVKKDLVKQKGEKEVFGLVMGLSGEGVDGDNQLEGNEEALTTYDFNIWIDQTRNAIRSQGKLDDQKSMVNVRAESKPALKTWLVNMIERQIFLKLAGVGQAGIKDINGKIYSAKYEWSNVPNTQSAAVLTAGRGARYYNARMDKLSSLTLNDVITPSMVQSLKVFASTAEPKIEPVQLGKKKGYVLFLHPWQFEELIKHPSVYGAFKDAANRGEDNPLFAGADAFYWDGVFVVKHEYVPYLNPADLTNKNFEGLAGADIQAQVPIARAILCGKQAGVMAMTDNSKTDAWVEKDFDYGNKVGIATFFIGGIQKTVFNSKEFGCIVLDTAVKAPMVVNMDNVVAVPTTSVPAGTVEADTSVTLSCATTGATILYTTDGSTPGLGSNVYSSALTIAATTTVKAIAVKSGMINSQVMNVTYTVA